MSDSQPVPTRTPEVLTAEQVADQWDIIGATAIPAARALRASHESLARENAVLRRKVQEHHAELDRLKSEWNEMGAELSKETDSRLSLGVLLERAENRIHWLGERLVASDTRFVEASHRADEAEAALAQAREQLAAAREDRDTLAALTDSLDADRDALRTELAQAREQRDAVLTASEALITKLDACIPHINGAFVMAHVHGASYNGPKFGEELEALRQIAASGRGSAPQGDSKNG